MNWFYSNKTNPNGNGSTVLCQECGDKTSGVEVSLSDWPGYPITPCEKCNREQMVEPHTLVGCGCPSCRLKRMRDPLGMFD